MDHNLARSANLPTGLYILPSIISNGPIFTIFSPNEKYLRDFSRSGPLFYSFRDVAMATNFWQNLRNDLHPTCWHFETDLNFDLEVIKGTIFAIFWAILVKIGTLTQKITQGVSVHLLGRDCKKRHIIPNISASRPTRPNFANFSALVGSYMQIIKLKYFLQ